MKTNCKYFLSYIRPGKEYKADVQGWIGIIDYTSKRFKTLMYKPFNGSFIANEDSHWNSLFSLAVLDKEENSFKIYESLKELIADNFEQLI